MKRERRHLIVWVKYGNLDTGLDRVTWLEMGRALTEQGYDVTLVTGFAHSPGMYPGWREGSIVWLREVPIRLLRLLAFNLRAWWVVAGLCLSQSPEFIILSVPTFLCALPFDILARVGLPGPKTLIDLRTFEFGGEGDKPRMKDRAYRVISRMAFSYGRAFHFGTTAINSRLAAAAVEMGAHPRVGIWGSGWRAPSASPPESERTRDLRQRTEHRFVVMYHGVMAANRGLLEALAGFRIALQQRPDLMFVLLGDGPLLDDLRKAVAQWRLSSDCLILPPVASAEVWEYLSVADLGCAVYPDIRYWDFNHPIKVAEYLSQGIPVLCSRIPMFTENYADCTAMIYCDSLDPGAIADSLTWCRDHREDLARRGSQGRHYAEGLSWDRQAERLGEFLGSLH